MSVLLVTGTGTGVGKTVVSAAIVALARDRAARPCYVKAAQTGVPGDVPDVDTVRALAGDVDTVEGARFPDPLSPAAAARIANQPPVELGAVADVVVRLSGAYDLVVVEGAGGLLVRYDEDGTTLADLARDVDAEVLVVAEAGLGTLNATALTLESMANRGVRLGGLVIGSWPAEPGLAERSNIRDLEMLVARPLAGALPANAGDPTGGTGDFLSTARSGLGPQLGGAFDAKAFRERWSTDV
ncbi:MAG TPA: dethiobiotin synthase [Mycobacteriales bacterium]|nr:dethiobiotin synthase [Mycobacteriales bacterium]